MIQALTGGKALPGEVQEQIVAKTDGVPLFIEELAKSLLKSGFLREAGDHYVMAGPLPSFAIPTSLHDSLLARLDRLGAGQRDSATRGGAGSGIFLQTPSRGLASPGKRVAGRSRSTYESRIDLSPRPPPIRLLHV